MNTRAVLVNEEWGKKNFHIKGYESIEIMIDPHKNINSIEQKINRVIKKWSQYRTY